MPYCTGFLSSNISSIFLLCIISSKDANLSSNCESSLSVSNMLTLQTFYFTMFVPVRTFYHHLSESPPCLSARWNVLHDATSLFPFYSFKHKSVVVLKIKIKKIKSSKKRWKWTLCSVGCKNRKLIVKDERWSLQCRIAKSKGPTLDMSDFQ